jgi:hypothetical protein
MYTSRTHYIPRHAAETRLDAALRDGMKQAKALWAQAREAARKARKWADKAVRAINAKMEEEMSEAGFLACGFLLGVILWPIIIICYLV